MNSLYIEAYEFYKGQYANSLVLFHVGNAYEAYQDDAEKLSQVIHENVRYRCQLKFLTFPESGLVEVMRMLLDNNIPFSTVNYRGADGSFTVPKVKQILDDMEADY